MVETITSHYVQKINPTSKEAEINNFLTARTSPISDANDVMIDFNLSQNSNTVNSDSSPHIKIQQF